MIILLMKINRVKVQMSWPAFHVLLSFNVHLFHFIRYHP